MAHRQDAPGHDPHATARCWYDGGTFVNELTSHLPFSIMSVTIGLMLAGLICFFTGSETLTAADRVMHADPSGHAHAAADHTGSASGGFLILFHLFHPSHMLFSAAATAAMFMRYERNLIKAVLVGFSGAVVICGISDIVMPHFSAMLMGHPLPWHICLVEHPMMVLPFAAIGVTVGLLSAASGSLSSTIFSHSMHVFVSTMASIFYLVSAFGRLEWIQQLGSVFLFICLAVMIPCCMSDIVYPLLFTPTARDTYSHEGHHHPH